MDSTAINIFGYSDFRAYLRDYYSKRHSLDRSFSHRFLAQKLGDKSPSFLQKLLDDERRLSPHQIEILIHLCRLEEHEAKYFRVLYLYSSAPGRTERELYLEQLISLNHTPRRQLELDLFEFYRHWYHPALRSILSVVDVQDDFRMVTKMIRPRISVNQVKDSIALMARLEIIQKDANGYWKPASEALFVKDNFNQAIIQNFRQQCLDLASQALVQGHGKEDYHFSTGTMSVSSDAHRRIFDKLEKFRAEIRSIVRKDSLPPTKVIQLQTQIFPLMENDK
jgi:uncharacterized protein (TIGR02147 family)